MPVVYITPKDEERERNDGFFIVNTGPCEARSCSRDCLFTITPAVWLTPNSKSMTPNHLCLSPDSGAGRPGHFRVEMSYVKCYPQESSNHYLH